MKLTDLQPRWVHANLFVFLCPHCRKTWLTCKNVTMSRGEVWDILVKEFGDGDCLSSPDIVVPPKASVAWTISGSQHIGPHPLFESMTVAQSIDASESGHWHGHITNGEIVGGVQLA
jgi:hypothetical protein